MRIAVCFKVVTDYDKASPKEIKKGDFSYTKKSFGFFDEGALELALRLKDSDKNSYLACITYGEYDEIYFEKLYQLGFDKVVNIKGHEVTFNSKGVAKELSKYIKGEFDLILTGEMVGPNDSGSVPFYLANYLNIPIISKVTNFDKDNIYTENAVYRNDKRMVLSITNSIYPYLRFPNYRDLNKAKENKVDVLEGLKFKKGKLTETKRLEKEIEYVEIDKVLELLEVRDD